MELPKESRPDSWSGSTLTARFGDAIAASTKFRSVVNAVASWSPFIGTMNATATRSWGKTFAAMNFRAATRARAIDLGFEYSRSKTRMKERRAFGFRGEIALTDSVDAKSMASNAVIF